MVRLLKLNNSKLSSFEKDSLKKNITRDLEKRRKSRQIRLIWQYAAACILIVCTLGSLYLINKENVFQGGEALSLVDEIQLDTDQTEVELHLAEEKMEVADNATILVDQQGKIKVADKSNKNVEAVDSESYAENREEKKIRMNPYWRKFLLQNFSVIQRDEWSKSYRRFCEDVSCKRVAGSET